MFFYAFKGDGNALYSPEFPRGALEALFSCQIIQILNSPTVTITVQGRNDDVASWSSITTFASITTTGYKTAPGSAIFQIVRYKIEVTGASDTSGVAMMFFAPQWRPDQA